MGQIKVTKAPIEGLYVIEPTVHGDDRGYFMETYNLNDMKEAGLNMNFVQDNQSMSTKGVLRGLHFQKQYPQGLIFVNGEVNMREGRYAIIPLFWINALLAIYLGISISKLICRRSRRKWLSSIGSNSIVYVCLNQITIFIFNKMFSGFISFDIITRLFILGLSMIILYWAALIFTKTRLRIFIGK